MTDRIEHASTVAEISIEALRHNVRLLARRSSPVALVGVVKADAYGHSSKIVSPVLLDEGIGRLAVATLPEAMELRDAGISVPIHDFEAPRRSSIAQYGRYDVEATITSVAVLDELEVSVPDHIRVHVNVDTGMGRQGLAPREVAEVVGRVERNPKLTLAGIFTHFATGHVPNHEFSDLQWRRLMDVIDELGGKPAPLHVAATGGIFNVSQSVDPGIVDFVRVGIGLYGLMDPPEIAAPERLQPVMRLRSRVSHIKDVPAGTPISYDGIWTTPVESRIATVAAGYADGVPRALSNRGEVGLNGHLYPIVGKVCMDMLMVNLGPPHDADREISPGTDATLFGSGGPSAFDVARWSDSISYEVACRITARVPRIISR